MLRRTIALALAGLALAAPPALARSHSHWNSRMMAATATASRSPGGCSIKTIKSGRHHEALLASCTRKHTATLVYVFTIGHGGIQGTPTAGVSWSGRATVHHSVKVARDTLRVTVTITAGTATLSSVSVGYYSN